MEVQATVVGMIETICKLDFMTESSKPGGGPGNDFLNFAQGFIKVSFEGGVKSDLGPTKERDYGCVCN